MYRFAKEQAQFHWQREFDAGIQFVSRKWRSTNGQYWSSKRVIQFSLPRNAERTWEQVQGTLLHELVHWHLHTTGQRYRDSDIEFAQECLRVGAPISGTHIARKVAERARKTVGDT